MFMLKFIEEEDDQHKSYKDFLIKSGC